MYLFTHSYFLSERNQDLQLDNDYFDPEDVLQNVFPEGEFDSDESESLFVRMGRNMHDVTEDGGVMKKILTQGVGSNLAPDALVRGKVLCYSIEASSCTETWSIFVFSDILTQEQSELQLIFLI